MSYGLDYVSGLGSQPLSISGKPMLSIYAEHTITTSVRESGLLCYLATLTVNNAPIANYIAVSAHANFFSVQCVPLAAGGYTIYLRTVTPQTVVVKVLTDGVSHLSASDYGLAVYSDTGVLQYTSNGTYMKANDEVYISPTLNYTAQTLTFANPLGLTPHCAFGGTQSNGLFRIGSPPANVSMGWPFVKFASNTSIVYQCYEVYLGGGGLGSYLFPNYTPIFLL